MREPEHAALGRDLADHVCSLFFALVVGACGRGAATDGAVPNDGGASLSVDTAPAPTAPDPLTEELWERAGGGELADLARLFDHEGETGIALRARLPAYRMTALAALACAQDFTPLPLLADVAATGTDAEALVALTSAETLAALPEMSHDPEDALELQEGCSRLVGLASQASAPPARRARAVSALRMLVDTGCIKWNAIPVDLDPK